MMTSGTRTGAACVAASASWCVYQYILSTRAYPAQPAAPVHQARAHVRCGPVFGQEDEGSSPFLRQPRLTPRQGCLCRPYLGSPHLRASAACSRIVPAAGITPPACERAEGSCHPRLPQAGTVLGADLGQLPRCLEPRGNTRSVHLEPPRPNPAMKSFAKS